MIDSGSITPISAIAPSGAATPLDASSVSGSASPFAATQTGGFTSSSRKVRPKGRSYVQVGFRSVAQAEKTNPSAAGGQPCVR